MSEANKTQVGGLHYKGADMEHWDLVLALGLGYFEGQATKYVMRWRKKNGVEDLKKSVHYLQKLRENVKSRVLASRDTGAIERCLRANNIGHKEAAIIYAICLWQDTLDLTVVINAIEAFIREVAEAVPAEDSNRHAARV